MTIGPERGNRGRSRAGGHHHPRFLDSPVSCGVARLQIAGMLEICRFYPIRYSLKSTYMDKIINFIFGDSPLNSPLNKKEREILRQYLIAEIERRKKERSEYMFQRLK